MNRFQALALVVVLWAAIFLPGLGSTEIKGEEGRRILPAVSMLDGGSWLVPYVGGKPFLRKPPLVNWLIAASFHLSGVRNEWSARMPSALCVLALALTIVGVSSPKNTPGLWMAPSTALVAAIFVLTQFGLLAKARFACAEIEGVYVPLSGMAIVTWMAWWFQRRSPWLIWTLPFVILGIAALAKGPSLHLLFFYLVVLAVLGAEGQWRALLHPAHLLGLALASAIFAAWAVPFFHSPEAAQAAAVWKKQGIDRFTESDFNAANYFLNIPRALMDLLPWVILAPLLAGFVRPPRGQGTGGKKNNEPLAKRWPGVLTLSVAGCFIALLLVPGVLPRYVLPLGLPFALLLALALERLETNCPTFLIWHRVNRVLAALLMAAALLLPFAAGANPNTPGGLRQALGHLDLGLAMPAAFVSVLAFIACISILIRRPLGLRPSTLALGSGLLFGVGACIYAVGAIGWINRADDLRPLAAQIDAGVPAGHSLLILDPGYAAAIFYLRTPYRYALNTEDIASDCDYVLAREQSEKKLQTAGFKVVGTFGNSKLKQRFLLLQRAGGLPRVSAPLGAEK